MNIEIAREILKRTYDLESEIIEKIKELRTPLYKMINSEEDRIKKEANRNWVGPNLIFPPMMHFSGPGVTDEEALGKLLNMSSFSILPDKTNPKLSRVERTLIGRVEDLFVFANLATAGQVAMKCKAEMLKYNLIGKKAVSLIEMCLENQGLSFGMNIDCKFFDVKLCDSVESFLSDLTKVVREQILESLEHGCPLTPEYNAPTKNVADITLRTKEQLLALPGFTQCHLETIEKKLSIIGRSLLKS